MSKNQKKLLYAFLSILLSSILWLFINVITDPEYQADVRNVPVIYSGEEVLNSRNLFVIENQTPTLRLTFDGRKTDLSSLDNKTVSAVVDLSTITTTGLIQRPYEIVLPDSVKNSVRPTDRSALLVDLFIDKTDTKVIDVRLVSNIAPADGYIVDNAASALEPHEVRISGPSTILERIEYAEVTFNRPDGITQSVDSIMEYKLKDINGDEIISEHITADYPEVRLTVPVLKEKTITLDVEFRDGGGITLANNVNYTITPSEMTISGAPSVIEGINSLIIAQIDLSKVVANGNREYKITLPNGCENMSGQENAVVSIEIVGAHTQKLDVSNISVINDSPPDGYTVSIMNDVIPVHIRGPESAVQQVRPYNVRIVVDLNAQELNPGQTYYPATVHIDGFPSVGAVGDYKVAVNIGKDSEE